MSKRKRYGKKSDNIKKIMVAGIVILIVAVMGLVGFDIYNMPDKVADREINELAKEYYEKYFYQNYKDSLSEDQDVAELLEKNYAEASLEPVYLRQLMVYSRTNGGDPDAIFDNAHYKCNANVSKVTYQPVAPYGEKDYTYTVDLSCKEK